VENDEGRRLNEECAHTSPKSTPHPACGHLLPIRCGEGIYFVGRFTGVAAAHQHRANFRSAFSAFQFVRIHAMDSLAPARSALAGLRLRQIPFAVSQTAPVVSETLRLGVLALKNRRNPRSNHFSQLILISFLTDLDSWSVVTGS
jgi:hypothetical protein